MKIIDKYILKRYLVTFSVMLIMFIPIGITIDVSEKVNRMIENKLPLKAILVYYGDFTIYFANLLFPIFLFLSIIWFTSKLANNTEIIAILSSGVSFTRLMRPYLIGSSIIALGTFGMIGWVVPNANKIRVPFEHEYINGTYFFDKRDVHIKISPDVYAYIESYDNSSNTGYRFSLERIADNEIKQKLMSDRITCDSLAKKWTIHDYRVRTFSGGTSGLKYGTKIDTTLNLLPKDFQNKHLLHETFTLPELNRHIDLVRSRGADGIEVFLIEKYLRFANPFSVIILTIIGFLVSARKSRGGVGFQIALGFCLAFVYILFFMMSKGIAEGGGMPPMLAVWLPNIVFSAVGVGLYYTIPR
mgnify:CR=1 FL=1